MKPLQKYKQSSGEKSPSIGMENLQEGRGSREVPTFHGLLQHKAEQISCRVLAWKSYFLDLAMKTVQIIRRDFSQ